ncbi:MAG: COG4315 family predicted lipoprotein [Solirubrobacterales bacterium]
MRVLLSTAAAVTALALAGCRGDDGGDGEGGSGGYGAAPGTTATAEEPTTATTQDAAGGAGQARPGTEIKVSGSDYGRILFDGADQAIYLFEKERGAKSECYGECAEAWPPVLTEGEPVASGGADQGLLGTTERNDGTTQVTYGGHPLYYYVDDPKGEVLCQNVEEFGGLWLVVAPDGEAVR